MNINEIVKYIANYFSDMEHEIAICFKHMDRIRSGLTYEIMDAINYAINDYCLDNDYDCDIIMDQIYDQYNDEDLFYMAIKYIENNGHINEAFFDKNKRNPYDDNKDSRNYSTQPLKDDISLYDIRQRVGEILRNCNSTDVAIARKQAQRLYKMVDAMINQGK